MRVSQFADPKSLVISAEQFSSLLAALQSKGFLIIGPTVHSGAIVIDELRSASDLPSGWADSQEPGCYRLTRSSTGGIFSHGPAANSWKQWLYPPLVQLFQVARQGLDLSFSSDPEASPPPALLGVRACDLHAIHRLDQVLTRHCSDPVYLERRRQALIIGISCRQPGATCFCAAMGTGPQLPEGHDLALTEVLDGNQHYFMVRIGSMRGMELLEAGVEYRVAGQELLQAATLAQQEMVRWMVSSSSPQAVRNRFLHQLEDPRWAESASHCLSCGNCTLVCPTCFCTTVEDRLDLSGTRAERWRRWDSCLNRDFSYIHGLVVRNSPMSRYRQRLLHKFDTWVDQFGALGCVGCGRCITWCPSGMDLREELESFSQDRSPASIGS
jgi:sulfhydrogenase subunit beta (sulfur reductase)